MKRLNTKGFFLIEVVIAASVITVVLMLLLGSIQNSVEASQRSLERTQASYLLEEGAEAVKVVRDMGWASIAALTNGTTYYLSWSGSAWSLTTTPQNIGAFTRSVIFESVSRNAQDDIVYSEGTLDTGTKKVTVRVSWNVPSGTTTEALEFYIANIR